MNTSDITSIIFVVMFCIYLIGSLVTMISTYQNNKLVLHYVRCIIRMQECKIIDNAEEVK